MRIAYFAHELEDPAVRKRVEMLAAGGAQIVLLGFERGRHAPDAAGPSTHVLGRTSGGRLVSRIGSVALGAARAFRLRAQWAQADVIMARNLEMLAIVVALAALMRLRARIIYECLDIHRLMLSRSPAGGLLRAIERACLARADLIVTSSPAFEARYFRDVQKLGGSVLVLENKVLVLGDAAAAVGASGEPPAGPPWRIAWCGVLRCRRSLELLRALSDELGGLLSVELWGAPALDQIPRFHEEVRASRHLVFKGAYARADLPAIYAGAHFVWAVDYYEAGGNSDWLLPNRLYEGLRFGAVPIAVEGVQTARWLDAHGVGVVLEAPLEASLRAFLLACTNARVAELREAAAALDRAATTATVADCQRLTAALGGGLAAAPA